MNCDRIASAYCRLEYAAFGRELERRRFRFLPDLVGVRHVLMLGEGDGRFLARFATASPQSSIHYVDSSARMLAIARKRAGTRRIRYQLGDALTAPIPSRAFDLIVTHFFLDCFDEDEQEKVIGRLAEAAACDSKWLISEFRQPGSGAAAAWAWAWLRVLYLFFRVTTKLKTRSLTNHRTILEKHGFRMEGEDTSWFGLLASEVWVKMPD